MVDTAAANATLKRKASRSPPEDLTPKHVKPGTTGEEVSTENGDANGNTKSASNDTVSEKLETVDTSPLSPKRAKLDAEPPVDLREPPSDLKPAGSNANGKSPEQARRPSVSSGPPAARKEIAQDERKRAKRLFGSLISTLSQKPSNSQQKRKHDVDRRQHEKAQHQRAEGERRRTEKLEERKAARKQQHENLEEELMEARHANMLARARSLRTRTEPRLYYQPWEPTEEQEGIIDDQIRKIKETIETERQESRLRSGISDNNHSHSRKESAEGLDGATSPRPETTVGERKNSLQDANRGVPAAHAPSQNTKDKDPDEEMVQDKEDTVIY